MVRKIYEETLKKKKRRRLNYRLSLVKRIITIFIDPSTRVGIRTRKNEGFTILGFGDPSPPLALHFGQVWRTRHRFPKDRVTRIAIDFFFRPAATIDPRSLGKYKECKER